MLDLLLALALIALVAALINAVLPGFDEDADDEGGRATEERGVAIEVPWAAIAVGSITAMALLVIDLPLSIVLAVAFLVGMVCHVALRALAARREMAFELALAASLDLVVASLRSGAALVESLGTAAAESRGAVGDMLGELCDRLRLGEPAAAILDELSERFPQEGARLLTFTLASHFESGGSAATSLGEVARAIRDRIDVLRRASSQSVETQASVVGILAITYGLALLMWSQYPERVETFAVSEIGRFFIGFSISLQAVGLLWISRMTRVEV